MIAGLELHRVPDRTTPSGEKAVNTKLCAVGDRESTQLYDRLTRCDEAAQGRFEGRRLGLEMLDE
jgi:hypothetical protein